MKLTKKSVIQTISPFEPTFFPFLLTSSPSGFSLFRQCGLMAERSGG
jgi:hypothetical protein